MDRHRPQARPAWCRPGVGLPGLGDATWGAMRAGDRGHDGSTPGEAALAARYAAVRRAVFVVCERLRAEVFRLAPRWRVEVSKGRCVEAGLS